MEKTLMQSSEHASAEGSGPYSALGGYTSSDDIDAGEEDFVAPTGLGVGQYTIDESVNASALHIPLRTEAESCLSAADRDEQQGVWCPRVWDGIHCWPPTSADTSAEETCMTLLPGQTELQRFPNAVAFRVCNSSGNWERGSWTNYSQCLDAITLLEQDQGGGVAVEAVRYITFLGSLISLLMLIISLFIFFYFRSLDCDRLRVHRNLLVALLLQFVAMLVFVEPYITHRQTPSYNDLDWLCRSLIALKMYGQVASVMWMFVEGFFLHSRLTCNVFDSAAPFKFYYTVGWGVPLCVLCCWCAVMEMYHHQHCWSQYSRVPYIWILEAPMLLALLINLLFLINIIRILVTKLRTNDSAETIKIRKAIRATVILFQLLGITNLLVAVNPGPDLEAAYMLINAVLQSSQGIIVTTMYCFLNVEVREVLRKRWRQYWVRHMGVRSGGRGGVGGRGGSYYQHRKSTFSTIVLPATFNANRAVCGTSNANAGSNMCFDPTVLQTYSMQKDVSPFRCSSFRKSHASFSETNFKSDYRELKLIGPHQYSTRLHSKRGFERSINEESNLSLNDNSNPHPVVQRKDLQYSESRHHHHRQCYPDKSNSHNKRGEGLVSRLKVREALRASSGCVGDGCSQECYVQTVCSNESCGAAPCSLSSCAFKIPYRSSSCARLKIDISTKNKSSNANHRSCNDILEMCKLAESISKNKRSKIKCKTSSL